MKFNKYEHPGTGAIEFARSFVEGLEREEALSVIKLLIQDGIYDNTDKRIKRCEYCSYHYRDKTKNNSSRTCSSECKAAKDYLAKAKKRADESLLKPKKESKRESYYAYWLEYPFWANEYEMIKHISWGYERPHSPDKLARIVAAKIRNSSMGGKRKNTHNVPYEGDELDTHKVNVKFSNRVNRKPSEIITIKLTREEIETYLTEKYSTERLALERKRVAWRKKNLGADKNT